MSTKSKYNKGFTLIEVIITLGIFSIISTFTLLASMDFWRSYSFRSERNLIVGILQKARSQSLSNINQSSHGVYIGTNQYVIFEGSTYSPTDPKNEVYESASAINHSGMTEVVYEQLSGKTSTTGGNLTLTYGVNQSIISTNNAGQINWTN